MVNIPVAISHLVKRYRSFHYLYFCTIYKSLMREYVTEEMV